MLYSSLEYSFTTIHSIYFTFTPYILLRLNYYTNVKTTIKKEKSNQLNEEYFPKKKKWNEEYRLCWKIWRSFTFPTVYLGCGACGMWISSITFAFSFLEFFLFCYLYWTTNFPTIKLTCIRNIRVSLVRGAEN